MTWQARTKLVLVAILAGGTAYDLAAYSNGGSEATISRIILNLSMEWPAIPFVFGMLCGHLFWSQRD